jgi:hypothetical protein
MISAATLFPVISILRVPSFHAFEPMESRIHAVSFRAIGPWQDPVRFSKSL